MARGNPLDNGYKMVAERHAAFVAEHPDGLVNTYLAHASDKLVIVHCSVWKDREDADNDRMPDGTGLAGVPIPGPTPFTENSEVENAETSALGRALAAIGYHPKDSMASQDEIDMKKKPATRKSNAVDANTTVTASERAAIMARGKRLFGDKTAVLEFLKDEFGILKGSDLTPELLPQIHEVMDVHEATQQSNG